MTNILAILVLLCAPLTLCTANDALNPSDSMQKRDGFDGMQPFQMAQGGPQLSMAAPQASFMQGASSNFPMSNPMGLGSLGGGGVMGMGGFGGGMGGGGGGGGGQGGPYVYEVDDDDDEEESGGGLGGLFSNSMMAMLPMAGLAFLGGLTFSSLSGLVLELLNGLQLPAGGNRVNSADPASAAASRQRRDLPEDLLYKLHQIDTFRKVLASMPSNKKIADGQLAAKYLSCSGLADDKNLCLERATCEFTNSNSTVLPLHKDALSMTVTYILKNDFVPQGIKDRIRRAATFGRDGSVQCETTFPCKHNKMFR